MWNQPENKALRHRPQKREVPNSKTAVLMLHGILGSPDHFSDMIPLVPAQWSVYSILLDGHGKTVDDFAASSMKQWKEQVEAIVSDLCVRYENIIIAGHSMGTLFAIDWAVKVPKIRGLFLLAVPLKAHVRLTAVSNAVKVALGWGKPDDPVTVAACTAYSIAPDRRVWKYFKWIPNYLALLLEMKRTRKKIRRLDIPVRVFQSGKDELVAKSSARYFAGMDTVSCTFLERSGHFCYDKQDYTYLLREFQIFCKQF